MVLQSRLYPTFSNALINTGTIGYNRYAHPSSTLGGCQTIQTFIKRFSRSLIHGYHHSPKKVSKLSPPLVPKKDPCPSHPSQSDVANFLTQIFTSCSRSYQSNHTQQPISPYHPSFTHFYTHFIAPLTDLFPIHS